MKDISVLENVGRATADDDDVDTRMIFKSRSLVEGCLSMQIDPLSAFWRTSPTGYSNPELDILEELKQVIIDLRQKINGIYEVEHFGGCLQTEILKTLGKSFRLSTARRTGTEKLTSVHYTSVFTVP